MRHLKPRIIAQLRGQPETIVVDPHGKPLRGPLLSLLKIVIWLIEEWFATLCMEKRDMLLLCDRYYHDLLVDPKRYRFGAPLWCARLIGTMMPQPALWILLDAAPEVLQSRKQEVSLAESARQCEGYRTFIRQRRSFAVVDSTLPLDDVVANTERAICESVVKRENERG